MKNYKRSERRHRSKCKLERRIKIFVLDIGSFYDDENNRIVMDGKGVVKVKQLVREGKAWNYLRHTSRPCNCWMCTYEKYKRTPKHVVIKDAMEE
jgi:hypothetical protein